MQGMTIKRQSTLRSFLLATAIVVAGIGGFLWMLHAAQLADHQARLQAIYDGRITLDSEKESLSPQEYGRLKSELENLK
jgi:hypothetical protein